MLRRRRLEIGRGRLMGYRVRMLASERELFAVHDLKVWWIPEISKYPAPEKCIFYDRIFTVLFNQLIINTAII